MLASNAILLFSLKNTLISKKINQQKINVSASTAQSPRSKFYIPLEFATNDKSAMIRSFFNDKNTNQ